MTATNALFDSNILKNLDYSDFKSLFKQKIENPCFGFGDSLLVRPLHLTDYDKGFLDVLKQLTVVGDVSRDTFKNRFDFMKQHSDYFVLVIEDKKTDKVIGTGSLVLEQKFIRNCGTKGKIEEIVVDDSYRGKEIGKLLVALLVKLAQHFKCYKLVLDCKDHMVPFYETFGLQKTNNFMIRYF